MRMGMAAIFSVVEMPLSQLHEEAALLHVATPSVQPLHGIIIVLPWGPPVEERLEVNASTGRPHELDT